MRSESGLNPALFFIARSKTRRFQPAIGFWTWMARYYCCTIGEVMEAPCPGVWNSAVKPGGHRWRSAVSHDRRAHQWEYLVTEARYPFGWTYPDQVKDILQKKHHAVIRSLQDKIAATGRITHRKFKPRPVKFIDFTPALHSEDELQNALDKVEKFPRQYQALCLLDREEEGAPIVEALAASGVDHSVINALVKKATLFVRKRGVSHRCR